VVTEAPPASDDAELERLGITLRRRIEDRLGRSLAIRQVDARLLQRLRAGDPRPQQSYHDVERFGVHFVASPRHADVLLVTGRCRATWKRAAAHLARHAAPKLVIAAGACAWRRGEFGVSYASRGAVENVIPVDVKIPGCPPTPLDLLKGLLGALRR